MTDEPEINDDHCPHGMSWNQDCVTCDTEYRETLVALCKFAGEGDEELGRQRLIKILSE